jgi:chemotaxis protein CheX
MIDLAAEVIEIVDRIGELQLGWTVAPSAPEEAVADLDETSTTATVELMGDFDGAVHISCTGQVARAAAAQMFSSSPASLSTAEIRDALGEIANMVAGNLKGRVPGASSLSLPTVVEGRGLEVRRLGSEDLATIGFLVPDGRILVRVLRTVQGNGDQVG